MSYWTQFPWRLTLAFSSFSCEEELWGGPSSLDNWADSKTLICFNCSRFFSKAVLSSSWFSIIYLTDNHLLSGYDTVTMTSMFWAFYILHMKKQISCELTISTFSCRSNLSWSLSAVRKATVENRFSTSFEYLLSLVIWRAFSSCCRHGSSCDGLSIC